MSDLRAFRASELVSHRFPVRRPLLLREGTAILREGHIGQIYAMRGVGKTWLLMTLAIVASSKAEALGISSPEPSRVLYIDGEMDGAELQVRFNQLYSMLNVDPPSTLTIVGADWQDKFLPRLDTEDGQSKVEPFVRDADLIILDSRSTLLDPEGEMDPAAWQPSQEWLLSLRRRRKASIAAHHANRRGGARGIGKAEDVMNLVLKLSRPEGYVQSQGARFVVEFEKARGIHGNAAEPFTAALTEDGWVLENESRAQAVSIDDQIVSFVERNPGSTIRKVRDNVPGKSATIGSRIASMVEESPPRLTKSRGKLYAPTKVPEAGPEGGARGSGWFSGSPP